MRKIKEASERKHSAACENATHDLCRCSCGGELHGIANEDQEESDRIKEAKKYWSDEYFFLCEYSFVPYPTADSRWSLGADAYAWVKPKMLKKYNDRNHALAIWKDNRTGEFVVRKEYRQASVMDFIVAKNTNVRMVSNESNGKYSEEYRGNDFQKALDMVTILSHKYWRREEEWVACDHSKYSRYCAKRN